MFRNTVEDIDGLTGIESLRSLTRRPCAVDFEFKNIAYEVKVNGAKKTILSGVSGKFRHGRLNAIMGASGAGKSSLLNVLAGFNCITRGTVSLNGVQYEASKCLNVMSSVSSYILQSDYLLNELTSFETVYYSAKFKLGDTVDADAIALQVLELTGLSETANRRVCQLSGGQKKRLCVAVELVNYPPIMFLDECTTGLDSSSCYRLIKLLKKLSQHGCNIITTIHQPNSQVFRMFDSLYVMAPGGVVAYSGHPMAVSLALRMIDVHCPENQNFADVLFERKTHIPKLGEVWSKISQLKDADFTQANALEKWEELHGGGLYSSSDRHTYSSNGKRTMSYRIHAAGLEGDGDIWLHFDEYEKHSHRIKSASEKLPFYQGDELIRFCTACDLGTISQLKFMFLRMLVYSLRDKIMFAGRYITFLGVAIMMGLIFHNGIGDDASMIYSNEGILAFLPNAMMVGPAVLALMQFEDVLRNLIRENINRWYNVTVYFVMKSLFELFFNLTSAGIFTVIVWSMTDQIYPRLTLFPAVVILSLEAAVTYHFMLVLIINGETQANLQLPGIICLAQCVFGGGVGPINEMGWWIRWVCYANYGLHAFFGVMRSVYSPTDGSDPRLPCPSESPTCLIYPNGGAVLRRYSIPPGNPYDDAWILVIFFIFYFLVGWFLLVRRLQSAKRELARV